MQVLATHAPFIAPKGQAGQAVNDPRAIASMYAAPPAEEIAILELEEMALARLRVLKGLEYLKSQGKGEEAFKAALDKLLHKHLKAEEGQAASQLQDSVSHFVLRLAFCRTEEHRRWLTAQETELFRHRYSCLPSASKAEFMRESKLPYEVASAADVAPYAAQLAQTLVHIGARRPESGESLDGVDFYRVPFEQVPDLVAARKVFIAKGTAFVAGEQLASVVAAVFRARLARALALTAGRWATSIAAAEADRLAPVIASLATRHVTEDGGPAAAAAGGDGARISLAQLPSLAARHFPLCMQHLYSTLQSDRHLRHAGRMQLGLFLKRAGLTLEESMSFWKSSFAPRTTGEKFEKEYAYNIRHSYGREGRRKDYEAQSCLKVISAAPGVGEAHGCPFKTLQADSLKAMLSRAGVPMQYAA